MKNLLFLTSLFTLFTNIIAFCNDNKEIGSVLKNEVKEWVKKKPVLFLENRGQMISSDGKAVPFVLFKAEAPGVNMYITERGLTYVFFKTENEFKEKELEGEYTPGSEGNMKEARRTLYSFMNMELKGAKIKSENIIRENASGTDYNFFYSHCPKGIYGVKEYEKLIIKDIYPGIDWLLYSSSENGFKYDFIVHPFADPSQIKMLYSGENLPEIDAEGNLYMNTELGELMEKAPFSYIKETAQTIKSRFIKKIIDDKHSEITFEFNTPESFRSSTLIIDPELTWGTFFGGNNQDNFYSIDVDSQDNVYVAGRTWSANLPVKALNNAYLDSTYNDQTVIGAGSDLGDLIILKFSNEGVLEWATYYGGRNDESGNAILSMHDNALYVYGTTWSDNFPTQSSGAAHYDSILNNGASGSSDAFILRFSASGALEWATLFGGSANDIEGAVKADNNGNIYFYGITASSDFPVQKWGSAYYDSTGNGNNDMYIGRFSNTGVLEWVTYYGGSGSDLGYSVTTDTNGNVYMCGFTNSLDIPVRSWGTAFYDSTYNGGLDIFILRFSSSGTLEWATYYGGSGDDFAVSPIIDENENIYIGGYTSSSDFYTQQWGSAYYDSTHNGNFDIYILRFSGEGILEWSTFYGGSASDVMISNIKIDNCGNLYVSFSTNSSDVPTFDPECTSHFDDSFAGDRDIFILKFSPVGQVSWASFIGSDRFDIPRALTIDHNNNLFLGGNWNDYENSSIGGAGLPLLNPGGGAYYDSSPNGGQDFFILKFIADNASYALSQVNSNCNCNGEATVNILACDANLYSYLWSNGNQTLNTTQKMNTLTGLCPGDYWIEITSCNSKKDTVYFSILESEIAEISINDPTTGLCEGDSILLDAGAGFISYQWSTGDTSRFITVDTSGNYIVAVVNGDGCSSTDSLSLTINSNPVPIITSINGTKFCKGDSSILSSNYSSGNSWNNGLDTTQTITVYESGSYIVTITNNFGCKTSDTVEIIVYELITNIGSASVTCYGGNDGRAIVEVTGGSGNYSYSWAPGGQADSVLINVPPGNYTVTIRDNEANCIIDDTITIIQPPPMVLHFSTEPETCMMENGWVKIDSISNGTKPFSYSWNSQPLIGNDSISGLKTGMYEILIKDSNGCTDSDSIKVEVEILKADFSYEKLACTNQIQFINLSSDTLPSFWYFGDGITSNESNPLHLYSADEKYSVMLITNPYTICADTTEAEIPVENYSFTDSLFIPNVFSPNGDGYNDYFEIIGTDNPCIGIQKLSIFNRWGKKVFEVEGNKLKWDGTNNENKLKEGVYFYILETKEFKKSGSVTLLGGE